jgi:hypothetical protein
MENRGGNCHGLMLASRVHRTSQYWPPSPYCMPSLAHCRRWLTAVAGSLPSLAHCPRWPTALAGSLPSLAHCPRWPTALAGPLPSLAHCPRWLTALAGSLPSLAHCPRWPTAIAGSLPSLAHCPRWLTAIAGSLPSLAHCPRWPPGFWSKPCRVGDSGLLVASISRGKALERVFIACSLISACTPASAKHYLQCPFPG